MSHRKEIRILAATGSVGTGFQEASFEEGLRRKPHFIGCDAGSTDSGPALLGAGRTGYSRSAIKRDLRLMIKGGQKNGIPVLVGTCGSGGGAPHVAIVRSIAEEIAEEEGLSLRVALIHAEQDKETLKRKLREGRIRPLKPAPEFDEAVIERAERFVAMMGAEPFLRAVDEGADLVLAGRASDTAIFAGIPERAGLPSGLCWHAAKILECGAAATVFRKTPDCMFATISDDGFVIEPLDPDMRCTPQSVAAHGLYENTDPFLLHEPSGTLDLTEAAYAAVDDRAVRVTGSAFRPAAQYTNKLEGAELVGYQSILIASVRDKLIIGQIEDWTAKLKTKIADRIRSVYDGRVAEDDYDFTIKIYGRNGTMGPIEPETGVGHEIALLFQMTAATQELASELISITRHQALHFPIPEWSGSITSIAMPFSPGYLDRGPVYRFNANHVIEVDDPMELFRIEHVQVGH